MDDEAAQRGTSVYLVERRIDMLPKPLTEGVFANLMGYLYFVLNLLLLLVLGLMIIFLHKVFHFADICSLRSDVERLTFSVIWVH